MAVQNTFSIVLLGRYAGKDRAVAQALARLFGRDDAWGLQVVGASPIVLLHNLAPEQSEAILAALGDAENAGCQMEIQPGVDPGLPKLGWPAAPRIRGRLINEFTVSPIPFGQTIQPSQQFANSGSGVHIMPPTAAAPAQAKTVNLTLPCPYTGQLMKLTLSVQISRAETGTAMTLGASATQAGAPSIGNPQQQQRPTSRPNVLPNAYVGINTPVATSAVRLPGQAPAARQPAPVGRAQQPQQPQQIQQADEVEIYGGDQLIPLPDVPAAPMQQPPPRPIQRRSPAPPPSNRPIPTASPAGPPAQPSIIPLPDVPVIHGPNGHSPSAPPSSSNMPMILPMPDDPLSAPMDLDAFEAKVSASGIMRAVQQSDASQDVFDEARDDGSVCSVFMGKTNNSKVHQLVAELHGISVAEATRYCQKPIVALAKEVNSADAQDIKQRFAALNVNVRITKKK